MRINTTPVRRNGQSLVDYLYQCDSYYYRNYGTNMVPTMYVLGGLEMKELKAELDACRNHYSSEMPDYNAEPSIYSPTGLLRFVYAPEIESCVIPVFSNWEKAQKLQQQLSLWERHADIWTWSY